MRRFWFTYLCLTLLAAVVGTALFARIRGSYVYGDGWRLNERSFQIVIIRPTPEIKPRPWAPSPQLDRSIRAIIFDWASTLRESAYSGVRGSGVLYIRVYTTEVYFLPLSCVLAIAACTPVLWKARRIGRQQRSVRGGHCGHCGYDLRSSSERCPECGTPVNTEYPLY